MQLNETVPEDPEVLQALDKYSVQLKDLKSHVIGVAKVPLDIFRCPLNECNLGNLITDAYVYNRAKQYNGSHWTDAPIALLQAGAVRAPACAGNITEFTLKTILSFNNSLVVVNVTGASLVQAFENSAEKYPLPSNLFLQTSGVRVVYNIANPPGKRVKSVKLLCSECEIPFYSELDPQRKYGVVMTSYLHQGGDNFTMFRVIFCAIFWFLLSFSVKNALFS